MTPAKPIGPTASRPAPYLFRQVKPNWFGLFGKLASALSDPTPKGIATALFGSLKELFTLKPPSLEEQTYRLVQKSLIQVIAAIVADGPPNGPDGRLKPQKEAAAYLDEELNNHPIEIGNDFFRNPTRLSLLGPLARWLSFWLQRAGVPEFHANNLSMGLPVHFVTAVEKEYRENTADYDKIPTLGKENGLALVDIERTWLFYYAQLQSRSDVGPIPKSSASEFI